MHVLWFTAALPRCVSFVAFCQGETKGQAPVQVYIHKMHVLWFTKCMSFGFFGLVLWFGFLVSTHCSAPKVRVLCCFFFLVFFSGAMSWIFYKEAKHSPIVCISAGTLLTAMSGGTAFLLGGLIMRRQYRQLCCLNIPRDRRPLELHTPVISDSKMADGSEGPGFLLGGDLDWETPHIPREELVAVQLCPWYVVIRDGGGGISAWAVQGLLVIESPDLDGYTRLPIMLTSDFTGAARLMRQLALTLQVPFLFCADAEDFKAERLRARTRPAIQMGGTMS